LDEVAVLMRENKCPGIFAGDLFDKWRAEPELITFAMRHFPDGCYTIPGQHDLPYHSIKEVERSAYGTLMQAGKITHLDSVKEFLADDGIGTLVRLTPFHWKQQLRSCETVYGDSLNVAVIHKYVWKDDKSKYQGASKKDKAGSLVPWLKGFDAAIFGDNHTPWERVGTPSLQIPSMFNCGGFMRRRTDEIDRKPRVGLLMSDGTVVPHELRAAKKDDLAETAPEAPLKDGDNGSMFEFMQSLEELGGEQDCSNLIQNAIYALKGERAEQVRAILIAAMEKRGR
jgi:DNA repair exonuclease SbcCD nuclease subunit